MRTGFNSELAARRDALMASKQDLESLYGETMGSDEVVRAKTELVQRISKSLLSADATFTSLNGTIKSIKTAVDPCHSNINQTPKRTCFIFEIE